MYALCFRTEQIEENKKEILKRILKKMNFLKEFSNLRLREHDLNASCCDRPSQLLLLY